MTLSPALAFAAGLAVFASLELVAVVLRNAVARLRLGVLYHLWSLALGVTTVLMLLPDTSGPGMEVAWKFAASSSVVLTGLVSFALFDALVFQRPWQPARGPMMPKLALDVSRLSVVVGLGLWAANRIYDVELSTVVISSTVLSAVVGLALQDVLKNVFAGLSLDFERPFARGDWLLIDGVPAQVMDMSWRSTRLRTNEGVEIYEPNGVISTSRLTNYGNGDRPMALHFDVGLAYDAPPERVRATLMAAAMATPGAVHEPHPEVFLWHFGDHAVTYRVRVWTREVASISRFTDAVNSKIWYHLHRAGLNIPFPIRTVHMHSAAEDANLGRQSSVSRIAGLLGSLDLFDDLTPEARLQLAVAARRMFFDHGETMLSEGDPGQSLLLIENGQVRVTKASTETGGTPIELARLGPGEVLGEMSLLTGEPRSATVTAEGGVVALELTKEAVAPVLAADPDLAENLSRALAKRQAATAATLESERGRTRKRPQDADAASLLARIRHFFSLG